MIKVAGYFKDKMTKAILICKESVDRHTKPSDFFEIFGEDYAWTFKPIKELMQASVDVDMRLMEAIDEINEVAHKNQQELERLQKKFEEMNRELIKIQVTVKKD